MKLTLEQVRHVAALARLTLTPAEEERYLRQLGEVLDYVATLDELDTAGIAPTSHAGDLPLLLRDDVVLPSLTPEAALQNAPARSGTAFAVPKILE